MPVSIWEWGTWTLVLLEYTSRRWTPATHTMCVLKSGHGTVVQTDMVETASNALLGVAGMSFDPSLGPSMSPRQARLLMCWLHVLHKHFGVHESEGEALPQSTLELIRPPCNRCDRMCSRSGARHVDCLSEHH